MPQPSGPHARFRPKDPRPISITLTVQGRQMLDVFCGQARMSRADFVEYLVRTWGEQAAFEIKDDATWRKSVVPGGTAITEVK